MTDRPLIVCWGELVVDEYEDPREAYLGGSAAAMAVHLAALGCQARLISAVGADEAADFLLNELSHRGVNSDGIVRLAHAQTGRVRIEMTEREPLYRAQARLDFSRTDFRSALGSALLGAHALLFNLFAQASCLDLGPLAACFRHGLRPRLVGCDLNLRGTFDLNAVALALSLSDFAKLNSAELDRLRTALAPREPIGWLLGGGLKLLAITRGQDGVDVYTPNESWHQHTLPFEPEDEELASESPLASPADTVGAGDAWFAAWVEALLEGAPYVEAAQRASLWASRQVLRRGALP